MTYVRVKHIESRYYFDNGFPLFEVICRNVGGTAEDFVPVQVFT